MPASKPPSSGESVPATPPPPHLLPQSLRLHGNNAPSAPGPIPLGILMAVLVIPEPLLPINNHCPSALGTKKTTSFWYQARPHAPTTQRGQAHARPLFRWHRRPVRANDFPCFYVWILRPSPRSRGAQETFHTYMYGFSTERARFGLFWRLSIPSCMDSSSEAPHRPLGRDFPYAYVWILRPSPWACGGRDVAVSAWVVRPVCPPPALYARARIGYNPD